MDSHVLVQAGGLRETFPTHCALKSDQTYKKMTNIELDPDVITITSLGS